MENHSACATAMVKGAELMVLNKGDFNCEYFLLPYTYGTLYYPINKIIGQSIA